MAAVGLDWRQRSGRKLGLRSRGSRTRPRVQFRQHRRRGGRQDREMQGFGRRAKKEDPQVSGQWVANPRD